MIFRPQVTNSSAPQILERMWRQLCVPDRVLDALVAQVRLNCSRRYALVRQKVARTMPKHVRVDRKSNIGILTSAGDQFRYCTVRQRSTTFCGKYEWAVGYSRRSRRSSRNSSPSTG